MKANLLSHTLKKVRILTRYSPKKENGAGEEDRTLDIHLGKVALYR